LYILWNWKIDFFTRLIETFLKLLYDSWNFLEKLPGIKKSIFHVWNYSYFSSLFGTLLFVKRSFMLAKLKLTKKLIRIFQNSWLEIRELLNHILQKYQKEISKFCSVGHPVKPNRNLLKNSAKNTIFLRL
jgi:hypothetical protein